MKKLQLFLLVSSATPALLAGPLGGEVYQVELIAPEAGMYLTLCLQDYCQRSLSFSERPEEYRYNFGTFPIADRGNVEFRVFRYYPEQRRLRLASEYWTKDACSVVSCGPYSFTKADGPITATTDKCELALVSHCDRHHPGKYTNARQWAY